MPEAHPLGSDGVARLGYVGYDVADGVAWRHLLVDVLGLEARDDAPADWATFRMDDAHHRIMLREAAVDRLHCIGWEMESDAGLDAAVQRLTARGTVVDPLNAADCALRAVSRSVRFMGPDRVPTELFVSATGGDPWHSPLVEGGFRTGVQGMGHVVIAAADPEQTVAWYQEMLGFRLSDRIAWDDAEGTFMHCNSRHHSLAILNRCFGHEAGDLNHVLFEVNDLDDLGRAYDRVIAAGVPLALSLGKHSNDWMISFYLVTPSGFAIEIGQGGIDAPEGNAEPVRYSSPKLWGHHPSGDVRV